MIGGLAGGAVEDLLQEGYDQAIQDVAAHLAQAQNMPAQLLEQTLRRKLGKARLLRPPALTKTMRRDEVIRLCKSRAQGADFTEELLRVVLRNAAAMLHRDRASGVPE